MNRRRARALNLALLLVSFLGPWGDTPLDFLRVAGAVFRGRADWRQVLLAAMIAVPGACFVALLAHSRKAVLVVYRLLLCGTAVALFGTVIEWLISTRRSPMYFVEQWGQGLYLVALVLASAMEFVPSRKAPKRDYVDVFR